MSGLNYWTEKEDDKVLALEHTPLLRVVIMFWTASMGRAELVWLIDPSWNWIHSAWNLAYFEILQHKSVHKNISDPGVGHNNQAVQKHSCIWIFPDIIFLNCSKHFLDTTKLLLAVLWKITKIFLFLISFQDALHQPTTPH